MPKLSWPAWILLLLLPWCAMGAVVPTGAIVVTAPEVHQMVNRDAALLINVLSHIEHRIQHIPGSINIPVDQVATSDRMPPNHDQPVIFYCNGLACPYSRRAVEMAIDLGYTRVFWFRGGILEWRKFQYPLNIDEQMRAQRVRKLRPAEFQQTVDDGALVLDVRPRWWRDSNEQAGVVAATEMMIPLIQLDQHLDRLPADRPILIVDRLMRQSVHAAKFLQNEGYNVAGVLRGGSRRWAAEGRPVLLPEREPVLPGND